MSLAFHRHGLKMKTDVHILLNAIPYSKLADKCLHPEKWTRDGHHITEVHDGNVWVEEPAGEIHGQYHTTAPHHVGYSKALWPIFMLDSAIEKLTFRD